MREMWCTPCQHCPPPPLATLPTFLPFLDAQICTCEQTPYDCSREYWKLVCREKNEESIFESHKIRLDLCSWVTGSLIRGMKKKSVINCEKCNCNKSADLIWMKNETVFIAVELDLFFTAYCCCATNHGTCNNAEYYSTTFFT